MKRSTLLLGASLISLLALSPMSKAVLLGPSPYLQSADSPFAGRSYSYFYLENFEDHLFNVPGVSASAGGVASVVFGPQIHDSVDADDGSIDGSGLKGDDFFSGNGAAGITFTFDKGTLGKLPTDAGLVWTDGGLGSAVTFEAFDNLGNSLGVLTGYHADLSNNGETAEDRFYGATNAGGISKIFISNSDGGIEIDHLQYGLAATKVGTHGVPDAFSTLGGLTFAAALLVASRRRLSSPKNS